MILLINLFFALLINESNKGTLKGKIVNQSNNEPISYADVYIEKVNRYKTTDSNGSFTFHYLEFAKYKIHISRIGYKDKNIILNFTEKDSEKEILIYLDEQSNVENEQIVEANRYQEKSEISEAALEISGETLRKNLGSTIAETISNEAGVDQRTMGPTPARPVLRGLGSDRLAVLEDGNGTGDLSATAADHAVVIEPLNSERIEIIRGPESLLYGSNTVAGVINVVRNYIPTEHVDNFKGTFSSQAETVSSGFSSAINTYIPVSWNYILKTDLSYRSAQNISTPVSILENTDIETYNMSFGNSYVDKWGYLGFAASIYESNYGIPPDPVTGHIDGVRIDLSRKHFEFKFDYHIDSKVIHDFEVEYHLSNYFHAEIEQQGIIGMEFGVVTQSLNLGLNLKDFGQFKNTTIKLESEKRDYNSGGLNLTPNSEEYAGSIQFYSEYIKSNFLLNTSIRFDKRIIVPDKRIYSNDVGLIQKNTYSGFSYGIGSKYKLNKSIDLDFNFLHTFRAPVIEELFKKGPHLSAYSFDVGNADLGIESANAFDLGISYQFKESTLGLSFFFNQFENYIFSKNTGINSFVISDLPLYKTVNQNVDMMGFEFSYNTSLSSSLELKGHISYVEGKLKSENPFLNDSFFYDNKSQSEILEIRNRLKNESKNLPLIPPLKLKTIFNFKLDQFTFSTTFRAALKQNLTGENEEVTDAYLILDLFGEYSFLRYGMLHNISLNISNALNTEYRNHLNRIKHIMPEASRNFRVLYKVYF